MRVKLPVAPYITKGRGQHELAYIICPCPDCPTAVLLWGRSVSGPLRDEVGLGNQVRL